MKLSDFTMETYNIAEDGGAPKYGEWKSGSRSNLIGRGVSGGKKYQVKIHAGEPKWFNVSAAIAAKQEELRNSPDKNTRERLESELASLERDRAKRDARDLISEGYLACKQQIMRAAASSGDPLIVGPADFWKQSIDFKGGATYAVEAAPWVDAAVGFSADFPLQFKDFSEDQKYKIVASLADTVSKLHACGVLHGDLKLGNTLIVKQGSEFKVALIDFDSALYLKDVQTRKYPFGVWYFIVGGTYFSPEANVFFEITRNNPDEDAYNEYDVNGLTEKADIFSLAITIYEYFYGRVDLGQIMPFVSATGEPLDVPMYGLAVAQGYKPNFPETMPEILSATLSWMLEADPKARPTAAQVRDIFNSKDLSSIPMQYKKDPNSVLWEEHRGNFELTLPEGVKIDRASKPLYRITRGTTRFTRKIEDLVREGLVADLNGTVAVPAGPDPDKGKAWPEDGGQELPACASRSTAKGKYQLTVSGFSKTVTYADLKREGVVCDPADAAKPWPCDEDIRFTSSKPILRDFAKGKGPGFYIMGEGITAIRYKKADLLSLGLATRTKGISFTLWASDAEQYEPCPENIPGDVVSISKNSITNHQYRVAHSDGTIEKLMIGKMLEKGYVKEK